MEKRFKSTNKSTKVVRKDKPTGIIYCRVSSQEQIDNTSLETQIEKTTNLIVNELGGEVVGQFIDEGESAKNADRTEFKNLLEFVSNNKDQITYVAVYKLDRWARSSTDFHITKSFIVKNGATLVSVLEPLSDDPTGRFLETVLAATAQLDNELKGSRVKDSMARKALDGWPQNKASYGYRNDKEKKITIKDQQFFEPIKTVLLRFRDGYPTDELAAYLNSLGLRTKGSKKRTSREFIPKDIWNILDRSKFYAGVFDHKEYLDIRGKYPAMITWDDHLKIQSKLRNKPIVNTMNTDETNTYILNYKLTKTVPFLTCSGCGQRIRSTISRGNGGNYPNYYCPNPDCGIEKKSIWKVDLEKLMEEKVANMAPSDELVAVFKDIVVEEWETEYSDRKRLYEESEVKVAALKEEKIETIKMFKKKLLGEEDYKSEMKRIELELMDSQRTHNENIIDISELEMLLHHAEYFLKNLRTIYIASSILHKRTLLQILFPFGAIYADGILRTNGNSTLFKILDGNFVENEA